MIIKREVEINGKDIEIEVEITLDDVTSFIEYVSTWETQQIHDETTTNGADCDHGDHKVYDLTEIETYNECAKYHGYPIIETLADQMKIEFIASIWDDFTLEEMEKKLKKKSKTPFKVNWK